MSTTTSEDGAVLAAQPNTNEAVNNDGGIAIVQDAGGTPVLETEVIEASIDEPQSETSNEPQEAVDESTQAESAETDDEIVAWANKKGLNINPDNPTEVKLARMQLESDRQFHAQRQSPPVPELLEATGDPNYDAIVERQNANELRMYVRDWFDAHPEMKQHRETLTQIAQERPWLSDMDDVAAHFLANPDRLKQVEQDGGRKALENLAQKQAAVPPRAGTSNPNVYGSDSVITPQNVYQLVDKNDQKWFESNYAAIQKAMQG